MEEGEKNTSYFSGLEKRRQERKIINSLIINDSECTDHKIISEEIYKFYSKFYSSEFSRYDSDIFLGGLRPYIPKIELTFKEMCASEIRMAELDDAIKKIAVGKAPGQDGLTSNFYKFFWVDLKGFLLEAIKYILNNRTLTQ